MDLLRTRQVDPVHQSPQTRMYGFFTHGTVPPSRLYSSGFLSLPDIFAGCLPRPTLVANRSATRFSPRFRYYSAVGLLTERRSPFRLRLLGPLTPMPTGDSVSSSEITRCSSVPCRPQTPWCG